MWEEKYKDKKDTPEEKLLEKPETTDEHAVFFAFTAYVFPPIPIISKKRNNRLVKYHIKQAVAFYITFLILSLFAAWLPTPFWRFVVFIVVFAIWCLGIIHALAGQEKPLPIIGRLAENYFQRF
jgi:uncharacterized membrane protein